MGETTKIEWCERTASPWHGCSRVHAGCDNCYAEAMSLRNPATLGVWGDDGTRVKSKTFVSKLRKWNKEGEARGEPVSVFPSICDPFEDRPELVEWRNEMFATIDECPWVRLMLLTKRPENVRRMWPQYETYRVDSVGRPLPLKQRRPNVWLLASVSNQATYDSAAPHLWSCRDLVPVLGFSAEPLLGPIKIHHEYDGQLVRNWAGCWDWWIVGSESGHGARPCDLGWIRSIVGQCREGGVACFVKQLGSRPIERYPSAWPNGNPPCERPGMEHFSHAEEELADALIRILQMAGEYGWNIQQAVASKMAFNRTRPHKHGKLA